jgi:hypothetical protein
MFNNFKIGSWNAMIKAKIMRDATPRMSIIGLYMTAVA